MCKAWGIMTQTGKTANRKVQKQEDQFGWTNVSEIRGETRDRVRSQILWQDKLCGVFLTALLKCFKSFKKGSDLCCQKIILGDQQWKQGNHLRC